MCKTDKSKFFFFFFLLPLEPVWNSMRLQIGVRATPDVRRFTKLLPKPVKSRAKTSFIARKAFGAVLFILLSIWKCRLVQINCCSTLISLAAVLHTVASSSSRSSSVVFRAACTIRFLLLPQLKGHWLVLKTLQIGAFQDGCTRFQTCKQSSCMQGLRWTAVCLFFVSFLSYVPHFPAIEMSLPAVRVHILIVHTHTSFFFVCTCLRLSNDYLCLNSIQPDPKSLGVLCLWV